MLTVDLRATLLFCLKETIIRTFRSLTRTIFPETPARLHIAAAPRLGIRAHSYKLNLRQACSTAKSLDFMRDYLVISIDTEESGPLFPNEVTHLNDIWDKGRFSAADRRTI